MAKCYGCGPRPDRIIRTGVTEPFDVRRGSPSGFSRQATTANASPFAMPIAAGPQTVRTAAPGKAPAIRRARGAVQKFAAVVQQIARKFAKGQPVKIKTAQGSMYIRPGQGAPTPGGIAGQLVAAARAVTAGRPVVVSTAAGVAKIMPGRQGIFQKMPQKDVGYLRGRVAATAVAGTRPAMRVDATQVRDRAGWGVFNRQLSAYPSKGTARQAARTAPTPFNQSAYRTPYQSIAMRKRTF